jgi:hypothetical protein
VTIVVGKGRTIRLLFPEFMEIYEGIVRPMCLDYNICGAGYPNHHCFGKRAEPQDIMTDCGKRTWAWNRRVRALRLAWYRLRYPVDWDKPREAYRAYLADLCSEAVEWLLEQRDPDGCGFCLIAHSRTGRRLPGPVPWRGRRARRRPGPLAGGAAPPV